MTVGLEKIGQALVDVVSELGVHTERVRPLLAGRVRELDAITEK